MLKLQGRFCSENRKIRVKLKKKKATTHKCVRHKIKRLKQSAEKHSSLCEVQETRNPIALRG